MRATNEFGFPYPELDDEPNGPQQIEALAVSVDEALGGVRRTAMTSGTAAGTAQTTADTAVTEAGKANSSIASLQSTVTGMAGTVSRLDQAQLVLADAFPRVLRAKFIVDHTALGVPSTAGTNFLVRFRNLNAFGVPIGDVYAVTATVGGFDSDGNRTEGVLYDVLVEDFSPNSVDLRVVLTNNLPGNVRNQFKVVMVFWSPWSATAGDPPTTGQRGVQVVIE